MLAEVLVDALAHREPDSAGTLEAAGRVRGRMLVRPRLGVGEGVSAAEAIASVVRMLQGFGFEARLERTEAGERIAMRPCPFGEMASSHSSIVCPVHLGLMRGMLDALGAPVEATSLEPFVEPHLCVARLHVTRGEPASGEDSAAPGRAYPRLAQASRRAELRPSGKRFSGRPVAEA